MGQYQALGFAKIWGGKARLPNERRLWEEYETAGRKLTDYGAFGDLGEEGERLLLLEKEAFSPWISAPVQISLS
jgi:hypothetical protein